MVSMKDIVDDVLDRIRNSPHETEVVEFKDRKTLSKDEMGEYFSALSNEANLKGIPFAWMIFGMTDDGKIVNSNYLDTVESQNKLKKYISEQTSGRMSYVDIYARIIYGKRVLLSRYPLLRSALQQPSRHSLMNVRATVCSAFPMKSACV